MLKSIPGKILFKFQKPGHGGYTFKCKNGVFITVNSLIWLFPHSTEVIQKINYLEIDGSFRAFPDYSFCLWHGIHFNETIPFALSVYPTEKFELYNILFECCRYYKLDENLFKGKIVLSDMGDSIKSFCSTYNMPQFFCHRHLIENFGSSSPLGMMVTRLIKCRNEIEYYQISQEINAELKIYIKFKEIYSKIDEDTQKNIDKLKIMISGYDPKNETSNYYIYKWARWLRADYHVARCSDHAEGAHGNINVSMKKRGASNFSSGLSATINYVLCFFQNRKKNHGKSFARHHINLKQKMIQLMRQSNEFDIQKCVKNCNCSDEFYNEKLYGVHLNCCHKILEQIYTSQQMKDFRNLNDVNIEQFLIHFLNMPINYSIEYTDGEIQKKVDEIVQFYSRLEQTLDTRSTFDLIKSAISFLSYKLPDILEFKEEFDKNEFHIEEAKPIDISNTKIIADTTNKIKKKVNNDDLTFWTRNCSNDIEFYAKLNTMKL